MLATLAEVWREGGMQSLGHHCTSFSSPNFSSSERRTASASSDTLTGKRRRGSTSVDDPETTGNTQGDFGAVCWKSFWDFSTAVRGWPLPGRILRYCHFLKGKETQFSGFIDPKSIDPHSEWRGMLL